MDNSQEEILKKLKDKYDAIGQDVNVHLEGLLHSKPITYWDYIQTDALLNLQIQRTDQPDEMVFIMYHQVNELLFKMILWEIDQVAENEHVTTEFFSTKLDRISRYFDMLSSSFTVMGDGMEVEQYMKFRNTLTPASGFQSAQYRLIEFASTELINLIDVRFRETIDRNTPFKHAYDHLYWQAAGKDHKTGEKSTLITLFEKRYMDDFIVFMQKYNTSNLWTRYQSLPESERKDLKLQNAMRHYDHTVNVLWVIAHLNAASKYLESGEKKAEATGGSDWKKYMHPRYQRRIFFPGLWTKDELDNWGITNLEGHEILSESI
ncbi:MAG: tryptophan 2,3-dioxygenase family protein [Cyclobacteriaceae bacterium]